MEMRQRRTGAAFLGVILLMLGACGRPENVIFPAGPVTNGGGTVEMLVATTRASAVVPGVMYSGERGENLAFADMAISIPPPGARQVGEVQWPERLPANPATDFVTVRADPMSMEQAQRWFRDKLKRSGQRRVLIFVHGFNNRYEEAVYRFAQIQDDSGSPAVPVLFTWPSRGTLLSYQYDRESTNYSRDALERVLQALARDPTVGEVSILAHSMGNWLTLEALRQMAIRNGRVAPKVKNVMLAAPDVDVDVFNKQIAEMGASRPNFTLFVSQDDRALEVSRRLSGGIARLGAIDPNAAPYRQQLEADGIAVLDLTALRGGDGLNHAKFARSPEVVRLIGQRLVEGQSINDPRTSLGESVGQLATGAAAAVGNAAGIVLSAPIAIVDPRSRESLGARFQELGAAVETTARSTGEIVTAPTQVLRRR